MLRRRLFLNSIASIFGKASATGFRVISVPLLISYLGVKDYGEWLLLSSLPSWLALANMSVGSVAGNGMTMEAARGNIAGARAIYSTTIAMLLLLSGIGVVLLIGVVWFAPIASLLELHVASSFSIQLSVLLLGLSTLLSFFVDAAGSRLRAAGRAHQSTAASGLIPWMDLFTLWIALYLKSGFAGMSAALLISRVTFLLFYSAWVQHQTPEFNFSWNSVRHSELAVLARKGFAFQSFPLGNALMFQGSLFIVNAVLGPVAVALFSTARTLTRSGNQLLELINQIIWPELSHLLGSGDYQRASRLHRLAVGCSILGGSASILFLWLFGPGIFAVWTRHQIVVPSKLLLIFLLPLLTNSIWYTSSVVHAACNEHEGLAARFLLGTVFSVPIYCLLSKFFGIDGAALSTMSVDILLIPYVLRHSLYLTHDSWAKFLPGMWSEMQVQGRKMFDRILNVVPFARSNP